MIPTTIAEYSDHLFSIAEGSYTFGLDNHINMPELVRRERPRHTVLVQQFQIARWPVSKGIWQQYIEFCLGSDQSAHSVRGVKQPMTNVSWADIMLSGEHPSFVEWCREVTGIDWHVPHEYDLELFTKTHGLRGAVSTENNAITDLLPDTYKREWCNNTYGTYPLRYPNDIVTGTEKSIRVVNVYRSTNLIDRPNTRLHAHVDYSSSDLGFRLLRRG